MRALCALGWALALDLAQVQAPVAAAVVPATLRTADGRAVRKVAAGTTCSGTAAPLGSFATPRECAEAVVGASGGWSAHGLFFTFGSTVGTAAAGACSSIDTSSEACPEGKRLNPDLDFYAVDTVLTGGLETSWHANLTSMPNTSCATLRLVKSNTTCSASSADVGVFANVTACGLAAMQAKATYFTFGISSTASEGACTVVRTTTEKCTEGWVASNFSSFYAVDTDAKTPALWISQGNSTNMFNGAQGQFVELERPGYTCNSTDLPLGNMSLRECAKTVASHGGKFIAYGPGKEECRMELTTSADCPEGWVVDHKSGFYAIDVIPTSVNVKALVMPPCLQPLQDGNYQAQTVVTGTGRSMIRRGSNPPLDPGAEALKEARAQRKRVEDLRAGLLRGTKAHAAALAPQKQMDLTGSREIKEEDPYHWEGPR